MNANDSRLSRLNAVQRGALIAGIAGLVLCAVGALSDSNQFFWSYLFAYVFVAGIGTGCLILLMTQYAVRSLWGLVIRRLLEAGAMTLPLLALLFIPLLFGLRSLYPWARPEVVASDPLLLHKAPYLNVPFFVLRAVLYFAIWIGLAWALNTWSARQDQSDDPALARRLHNGSILGLIVISVTLTFALIDWVMSLEPHWYSTIYSLMVASGGILTAFALVIAMLIFFADQEPLSRLVTPQIWNDLGNLLMAVLMTWAYLAFSQFLVIWSGNLSEEIPWYLRRLQGGWEWVALTIALIHFVLPFLLLLSRRFKRDGHRLSRLAALLVVIDIVNVFWLVAPDLHPTGFALHWLDIAALIGIGGVWTAAYLWNLKWKPLAPLHSGVELPADIAPQALSAQPKAAAHE